MQCAGDMIEQRMDGLLPRPLPLPDNIAANSEAFSRLSSNDLFALGLILLWVVCLFPFPRVDSPASPSPSVVSESEAGLKLAGEKPLGEPREPRLNSAMPTLTEMGCRGGDRGPRW